MLDGNKSAKGWFNIIMISIFSLGDTIGRAIAGNVKIFDHRTIIIMTLGRLAFVATSIFIRKYCMCLKH